MALSQVPGLSGWVGGDSGLSNFSGGLNFDPAVFNTPPAANTNSNNQNTGGGSPVTDLNTALSGLTGSDNIIQPNYPAGSFDVTPYSDFLAKAFDQLKPYYTQLLAEAGGDLQVALNNLETDYQTGKRTTLEDFQSSMDTLGLTMKDEQTKNQGDLNSRGFALTENPGGQTQFAGGGLAKSTTENLNSSQNLRAEAIQRTQQRAMQSAAITKLTGSESSQQSYRNTTETQQANEESQANSLAGNMQAADTASKNAGIAKAQADATTGSSGSSSGSKSSNWMDYYKGWDQNSANADFQKTYGGSLSKLQASKPE